MKSVGRPRKYELERFLRFVRMLDYFKGELKPAAHILTEAARREIIKPEEKNTMFQLFKKVAHNVQLFEYALFPSDQTDTGKWHYEYKIPDDMTEREFFKRIITYEMDHFKTELDSSSLGSFGRIYLEAYRELRGAKFKINHDAMYKMFK